MGLRGRVGGFTKASRYPPGELTRAARAGLLARFEREVDPDRLLPLDERLRRVEAARRAHMARLALFSARKRAKRVRIAKGKATAPTVAKEVRDAAAQPSD